MSRGWVLIHGVRQLNVFVTDMELNPSWLDVARDRSVLDLDDHFSTSTSGTSPNHVTIYRHLLRESDKVLVEVFEGLRTGKLFAMTYLAWMEFLLSLINDGRWTFVTWPDQQPDYRGHDWLREGF